MKILVIFIVVFSLYGCQINSTHQEHKKIELRLADDRYVTDYVSMVTERNSKYIYVSPISLFDNKDIVSINAGPYSIGYAINIEFSDKEKLFDVTSKNIGRRIAILIDGVVITAPIIQAVVRDGKVVITGYYTEAEAEQIVRALVE